MLRRLFVAALIGGIAFAAWSCWWPGSFSYLNYLRVRSGMSLERVEVVLGGPGKEIEARGLPGIVDWTVPVGSPKRVKPIVEGERFFRWNASQSDDPLLMTAYIVVGFKDGVVVDKHYWAPSL